MSQSGLSVNNRTEVAEHYNPCSLPLHLCYFRSYKALLQIKRKLMENPFYPPGFDERSLEISEDLCPSCKEADMKPLHWWKHGKREDALDLLECQSCGHQLTVKAYEAI